MSHYPHIDFARNQSGPVRRMTCLIQHVKCTPAVMRTLNASAIRLPAVGKCSRKHCQRILLLLLRDHDTIIKPSSSTNKRLRRCIDDDIGGLMLLTIRTMISRAMNPDLDCFCLWRYSHAGLYAPKGSGKVVLSPICSKQEAAQAAVIIAPIRRWEYMVGILFLFTTSAIE